MKVISTRKHLGSTIPSTIVKIVIVFTISPANRPRAEEKRLHVIKKFDT